MKALYARWMYAWEDRLCFAATNRVVRPFEWGLEWAENWPVTRRFPRNGHDPEGWLRELSRAAVDHSDEFFAYQSPRDFELGSDGIVRFTTAAPTPFPENNTVCAKWYPAEHKNGRRRVAAIVLPHWNAKAHEHGALCAGMAKLGISALRLSLPYHDYRMPKELDRADYAVSSNIGRTIDATRQAVIDIRSSVDWLESQGYSRIGICGTSLGSCYAFLASAHDPRLEVNVYNHCSTYFADVVWEGLSTQHIRQGLEQHITLDRLREAWRAISPPHYEDRYSKLKKKSLFIYARFDTTFPTKYSEQVVANARAKGWDHRTVALQCGHYTLGRWPFKYIDGYHICSFLKRNL